VEKKYDINFFLLTKEKKINDIAHFMNSQVIFSTNAKDK
jgi:hypothetical protein